MEPRKKQKASSSSSSSASKKSTQNQTSQPTKYGIQHFFERHSSSQNPKPSTATTVVAPDSPIPNCVLRPNNGNPKTLVSKEHDSGTPSVSGGDGAQGSKVVVNGASEKVGDPVVICVDSVSQNAKNAGLRVAQNPKNGKNVESENTPPENSLIDLTKSDDGCEGSKSIPRKRLKFSPGMIINQSQDDGVEEVTWKVSPVNERLKAISKLAPDVVKALANASRLNSSTFHNLSDDAMPRRSNSDGSPVDDITSSERRNRTIAARGGRRSATSSSCRGSTMSGRVPSLDSLGFSSGFVRQLHTSPDSEADGRPDLLQSATTQTSQGETRGAQVETTRVETTEVENTPHDEARGDPLMSPTGQAHQAGPSRVRQRRVFRSRPPPITKLHITPVGENGFSLRKETNSVLRSVWHTRYNRPWPSWSHIPRTEILLWQAEFRKHFTWDPLDEHRIWQNWTNTLRKRISTVMTEARSSGVRPQWLPENAWVEMCRFWESKTYRVMRERNRANRWVTADPTLPVPAARGTHISGAMPFARRLQALNVRLGRPATVLELYEGCHIRENGEHVDPADRVPMKEFNRRLEGYYREEEERLGRQLTDEERIAPSARAWIDACGIDSHGRIYGTGGEANTIREAAGRSRRSMRHDHVMLSQMMIQAHAEPIRKTLRDELSAEITRQTAEQVAKLVEEQVAKHVQELIGKGNGRVVQTQTESGSQPPQTYPQAYHDEMIAFSQHMASGTSTGQSYEEFMRQLNLKYFPEDDNDHSYHLDDH